MSLLKRKPYFFDSDVWDLPGRLMNEEIYRGKDLPAVNIKDNGDHYTVELAAPGYRREELKVNVANGVLNLSSERREESKEEKDHYSRREFHYSSFERSFQLPENANEEEVKARYADGILKLTIGKRQPSVEKRSKQIEIG